MRAWQHSTAVARLAPLAVAVALAGVTAIGCRRAAPSAAPVDGDGGVAGAETDAAPPSATARLLADVVDPWTWPRARGATPTEQAVENIGPYERELPGDPTSPLFNTNGHYWTALAGIAWNRDVDIDLDREPVDLDGDGRPDTTVTRHVHAKGGVLAHPEVFGLTPTPDDPRGRVGRISASTGVLGLREALRPDGSPSGEIGMACWLCHGRANPTDGRIVLGLPGADFDYGLLLATAAVLDERNAEAAAYRRAHGFPPGRVVQARLLLAGPGRQDLTGEFGLDVTVPGARSIRYPGAARVRQGTHGLVNPISVPGILAAPGVALENWSGSEDSAAPALERLTALSQMSESAVRKRFALDQAPVSSGDGALAGRETARRALLFDLRNLGTLGLQQDSFPGLLWADAVGGRAALDPESLAGVPRMYAATAVRGVLGAPFARPARDPEQVARGRTIFSERLVGTITNRQILKRPPRAYAAAKLEGPLLAPIDATRPLDARLPVRCADCHAASPLDTTRPMAEASPPLGRCTHCHLTHPTVDEWGGSRPPAPGTTLVSLSAPLPGQPPGPAGEVTFCRRCHERHRDFGPLVYSASRLFPFDADGDGDAQLHPAADRAAGGIGTDPWLAFDVPRPQWPFSLDVPLIADPLHPGHVAGARIGAAWVRTAPLVGVAAGAPYLHNGSVPSLEALLTPPAHRPKRFPLGNAGFVFDTGLPGNSNQGHDFGTALSPREKADLIAFLQTL